MKGLLQCPKEFDQAVVGLSQLGSKVRLAEHPAEPGSQVPGG
jgi:hypothetical protein